MWVSYQKTIEQRKKFLLYYVKHKQAVDRGEKPDAETVTSAERFTTINDTLKLELPLLYEKTKVVMRHVMTLFIASGASRRCALLCPGHGILRCGALAGAGPLAFYACDGHRLAARGAGKPA